MAKDENAVLYFIRCVLWVVFFVAGALCIEATMISISMGMKEVHGWCVSIPLIAEFCFLCAYFIGRDLQ